MKHSSVWVLTLMLFFSCSKQDTSIVPEMDEQSITLRGQSATSQTATVINAITGQETGQAKLVRNNNGITMQFEANDLVPGYTYTIWWVIWNKPEECAGSPCSDADFALPVDVEVMYAAGHVVGGSGKGKFSGHLKVGDDSESINDLFGLPLVGGLQNARTSEVHLVLRSHGPKLPGLVNEQISSYLGGCSIFLLPFSEIPDEPGECGDTEFAIFLPES